MRSTIVVEIRHLLVCCDEDVYLTIWNHHSWCHMIRRGEFHMTWVWKSGKTCRVMLLHNTTDHMARRESDMLVYRNIFTCYRCFQWESDFIDVVMCICFSFLLCLLCLQPRSQGTLQHCLFFRSTELVVMPWQGKVQAFTATLFLCSTHYCDSFLKNNFFFASWARFKPSSL